MKNKIIEILTDFDVKPSYAQTAVYDQSISGFRKKLATRIMEQLGEGKLGWFGRIRKFVQRQRYIGECQFGDRMRKRYNKTATEFYDKFASEVFYTDKNGNKLGLDIQTLWYFRTNDMLRSEQLKGTYREVDLSARSPKWSANWYFYKVYSGGHTYGNYNGNPGHMERHVKDYPDHKLIWLEPYSEWKEKLPPHPKEETDWNKLREQYFEECTYNRSTLGGLSRVGMAPHDLFEWFKKRLSNPLKEEPKDSAEERYLKAVADYEMTFETKIDWPYTTFLKIAAGLPPTVETKKD